MYAMMTAGGAFISHSTRSPSSDVRINPPRTVQHQRNWFVPRDFQSKGAISR